MEKLKDLKAELEYIKAEIDNMKNTVMNFVYLMGRLEVVMEDLQIESEREGNNGYIPEPE